MKASTTIGMKLDALIAQLDNLSSTQLYALIVFVTVLIGFVVLGNAPAPSDIMPTPTVMADTTTPTKKMKTVNNALDGPEPRWYIFDIFNYAMLAAFCAFIVSFSLHCAAAATSSDVSYDGSVLSTYLVGWSAFLLYFFGFFGVSFVHDDVPPQQEQQQQHEQQHPAQPSSGKNSTSVGKTVVVDNKQPATQQQQQQQQQQRSDKVVHPHAASAPVCSDPASFKSASADKLALTGEQFKVLSDAEIANLVLTNRLKDHELEKRLEDTHRAVAVRRLVVENKLSDILGPTAAASSMQGLPHEPSLDYSRVYGANCEIVVGYVPLPVGMVGPLTVNGETFYVPMATTEGCLVASTNRGAKAITAGGGATAEIFRDGITRAPCVRMPSAQQAAQLKRWCETPENTQILRNAFESTTSFGKLLACVPTVAGRNVYVRLTCFSGDAMGMNMVSKGSLAVIELLQQEFPGLQLVALSGNMCTDKKAAATNWLEGRGKSVVVEAIIPKDVVKNTLKTTVKALVDTNLHKNLIGSAMAGTIGGFNAHASNIVTAVFLATGQDPAQNVESSNCITLLEETEGGDLWISCTMPSLEVGTVGGGTSLPAQSACLQAIGCKGGGAMPGENAKKLATVVASATMAGELSLLAALAANTLVQAHMQHNRKPTTSSAKSS